MEILDTPRSTSKPHGQSFTPFEILSVCRGGGYKYCRTRPKHPKANSKGLYPLHRVVLENSMGRLLKPGEQAHHVDGDKDNNSPENLECLTASEHTILHKTKPDVNVTVECARCGAEVTMKPREFRLRSKRNIGGLIFCSRSCGARNRE